MVISEDQRILQPQTRRGDAEGYVVYRGNGNGTTGAGSAIEQAPYDALS